MGDIKKSNATLGCGGLIALVFIISVVVFMMPKSETTKLKDKLKSEYHLTFDGKVRNDVTGKWRIASAATQAQPSEYAADYYKAFFKSDDEIHGIVNFTLNTTTKMTVSGDKLQLTTYDYVKGEEHDAGLLFGGTVLKEETVDKP